VGEKNRGSLSESDVKLCALCGALNHHKNAECFTCGWRGAFEREQRALHLAWQRLFDQYGSVDLDMVTGSRSYAVSSLTGGMAGLVRTTISQRIRSWWRSVLQSCRKPRYAEIPPKAKKHPPKDGGEDEYVHV